MKTYFEQINESIFSFLLWDDSWKSFNNCYLIVEGEEIILIDSGKAEHFDFLEGALNSIGVEKNDIKTFLATHGHRDHIGGVELAGNAERFIHQRDLALLPENLSGFSALTADTGKVSSFEYVLLGHHTPGSVAFYHEKSKTLFCGDHLCFFGDPLPAGGIMVEGEMVKEQVRKFISDWAGNPEMREEHNFDLFIEGLEILKKFDANYLCTGHGVIIKDDITGFLSDAVGAAK